MGSYVYIAPHVCLRSLAQNRHASEYARYFRKICHTIQCAMLSPHTAISLELFGL